MLLAPCRTAAAGTLVAVLALVLTAPAPAAAWRTLIGAAPHESQTQALVALAALLAWALVGWSCAVVALTTGGHLPGRAGCALTTVARRTAPATVRHTVELALGLTVAAGVLTSPASAATGTATPPAAPPATPPTSAPLATATPRAPALDWGAEPADPAPAVTPGSGAPPQDPAARCTDVHRTAPTSAAPATATAVVVRAGDTLWDIAERHLRASGPSEPTDARVAASWPSWWTANRAAVGDDPHLLLPGTVLQPPPAAGHPPAR